eukprot:323339_1
MALNCFLIAFIMIINTVQPETKSCSGSCHCATDGPCELNCIGDGQCKGSDTTLTCRELYPCTIVCNSEGGKESCLDATIDVHGASSLTLHCIGVISCKTTRVNCEDIDQCDIMCNDGEHSCEGMELDCGTSSCSLDCQGDDTCEALSASTNDATHLNAPIIAMEVVSIYLHLLRQSQMIQAHHRHRAL